MTPTKVQDADLIRIRTNNPCATLQQIGDKYGVTREAIRQRLNKIGIETKAMPIPKPQYECLNCGILTYRRTGFCSKVCRHQYSYIKTECVVCGNIFTQNARYLIWAIKHYNAPIRGHFCSKQCFGKWLATNHGFIAHPENARKGRILKYNYEAIELELQKGTRYPDVMRLFEVPQGSQGMIRNTLEKRKALIKG